MLANARHEARMATLNFTVQGMSIERITDQLMRITRYAGGRVYSTRRWFMLTPTRLTRAVPSACHPVFFTDEEDMQQLLDALNDILS